MKQTYTFQMFDSKKYGGEYRTITKSMTQQEADEYAALLKNVWGWTSVCWGVM